LGAAKVRLPRAVIIVERLGFGSYTARIVYRPERGDSPFECLLLEWGPFGGWSYRRAWRKAWRAAGRPDLVEVDEL
jgi:hypothetical protein